MILTLDAETIPTTDLYFIEEISSKIKPPGNMSKSETIAKWMIEEKPSVLEKAIKDTSFDGGLGSIVCIGWAIDDEEPKTLCGCDEDDILIEFAAEISGHYFDKVVGHNITDFDLRFIWQRYVVLGRKKPLLPWNAKAWDDRIGDTMTMWNPSREKKISLDHLCKVLGIESPKSEMDGSMIADYAKAGRYPEIAKYNKGDIIATRECYKRMI